MVHINRTKYEQILKTICKSIRISVKSNELTRDQAEVQKFSELTGLPVEDDVIFRKLTALLILNRLRFIVLFDPDRISLNQPMALIFDALRNNHPNLFVSSILESIAKYSTFQTSLEELNFIAIDRSKEIMSTEFNAILPQKNRRKLGQFWTPAPVAEVMVQLLLQGNKSSPDRILDPCIGPGIFFQVLSQKRPNPNLEFAGIEIHPLMYEIAQVNCYSQKPHTKLIHSDFLTISTDQLPLPLEGTLAIPPVKDLQSIFAHRPSLGYDGIICNPPYSRHHVLSQETKENVGGEIEKMFGGKFSRISSQFMYFILKSLSLLLRNGRMVFITPTLAFESRNSKYLKEILKQRFCVRHIIVFHHSLNVFQGVDTAACIFVIDGKKPTSSNKTRLVIIKSEATIPSLPQIIKQPTTNVSKAVSMDSIQIFETKQADLDPRLNWTHARSFSSARKSSNEVPLSHFFRVMRGIATGRNKYFVLTEAERQKYNLHDRFLVPTVTKTRLIQKYTLTSEDFAHLLHINKKVWLLYVQGDVSLDNHPSLQKYLQRGELHGVPQGSLVKTRKLWYQLEKRKIPVLLFTYLSRGASRFILNNAGVRPLNSFLMLYPQNTKISISSDQLRLLWVILNSNETKEALRASGRSYGGDTLKLEPKELMMTTILNPSSVSAESRVKLLALAAELETSTVKEAQQGCLPTIDAIIRDELSR